MLPAFVPDALARLPQWVYWQSECTSTGKLTKVPYQINNWVQEAASNRPEEWETFEVAKRNFNVASKTGVGFVFAKDAGIFGIDVDSIDKVAPEDQEASMRLRALIHEHFKTYCEVSPSGTGRHYIGFGSLPDEVKSIKDSKYQIEVYDHGRFFTFTGDILDGRNELANCQEALNDLAHTMRGAAVGAAIVHDGERDERSVDQIISDIRGWQNGHEFAGIMDNPLATVLARYKNDHSSADFALANFIASATKDTEKAVEIFRRSPLYRAEGKGGYKPESKYIQDYLIDFCFAKVWGENKVKEEHQRAAAAEGHALAKQMFEQTKYKATASEKAAEARAEVRVAEIHGINLPMLDPSNMEVSLPPGMAGKYIKAIHDACYNPRLEFALAVGMAFMSGLTGRAYRFQRQGLNSFFIVAAKSATGKTQSIKALRMLLGALGDDRLTDRMYTTSAKSIQGMQSFFQKAPAGGWITDECGAQMKALTDPSSQTDVELKDGINMLFDSSGPGEKWTPPASKISQKEDKSITSLSAGIGWFTTREKVYDTLGDAEVADGFMSRFIPIFYNGSLGDDNFMPVDSFPEDVAKTIKLVWKVVSENDVHMPVDGVANTSKTVPVRIADDAANALRAFGDATRNVTRRAQNDADDMPETFVAMSRVPLIAQRLAAVCAVMDNPIQPVIMLPHIQWAVQLVGSRMLNVLDLMSRGQVGGGVNKEFEVIRDVVKDIIARGAKNGAARSEVLRKCRDRSPFRNARNVTGYVAAARAIDAMIHNDMLVEVRAQGEVGAPKKALLPTNDPLWQK